MVYSGVMSEDPNTVALIAFEAASKDDKNSPLQTRPSRTE
jgi:hypothetical protein